MTRLLLFTEEAVLARGFAALMETAADLETDSICSAGAEVAQLAANRSPDIVLFDFLPEDGLETVAAIRSAAPAVNIVLWVRRISFDIAFQAMKLGVRGILRKTLGLDLTLRCLRKVAAGEVWFEQDFSAGFLEANTVALTPRESQLVMLVSQGLKNKEIAATLSIADATVRMYLSALFRKVGVRDRYELAIFGLKNHAHVGPTAIPSANAAPAAAPRVPERLHVLAVRRPFEQHPQPSRPAGGRLTVVPVQKACG